MYTIDDLSAEMSKMERNKLNREAFNFFQEKIETEFTKLETHNSLNLLVDKEKEKAQRSRETFELQQIALAKDSQ